MKKTDKTLAIEKAWGLLWLYLPLPVRVSALRSDGWVERSALEPARACVNNQLGNQKDVLRERFDFVRSFNVVEQEYEQHVRPKSIQGIELNMGWTKVSGDNFPEHVEGVYYRYCVSGKVMPDSVTATTLRLRVARNIPISHFRRSEKLSAPLY